MNAGPATYSVTVTGSNLCTNTATKTVNVLTNPDITTVSANTPCEGSDFMLIAETETEGANFAWSGPNGFTSNEQNPTISNASTTMNGDYIVTVTDLATECSAADTVTVTVNQTTTGDTIAFACDSFDWYEHTNITESTETLTHTFTNASGCDSVVTLHLTVNHTTTGDTIAFACESFDWYEHTNITESTETLTHTSRTSAVATLW